MKEKPQEGDIAEKRENTFRNALKLSMGNLSIQLKGQIRQYLVTEGFSDEEMDELFKKAIEKL